MNKLTFASILMLSTAVFVSCSPLANKHPSFNDKEAYYPHLITPYGAYLAGRVAHIRKDFDNASHYYKIAYQNDKNVVNVDDQFMYGDALLVAPILNGKSHWEGSKQVLEL